MLTSLTLLVLAGGVLRFGLSFVLKKRFQLRLAMPQAIAGLLVLLAALPDLLKPVPFPLPFGLTLGLVLPDLIARSLHHDR